MPEKHSEHDERTFPKHHNGLPPLVANFVASKHKSKAHRPHGLEKKEKQKQKKKKKKKLKKKKSQKVVIVEKKRKQKETYLVVHLRRIQRLLPSLSKKEQSNSGWNH